LFFDHRYCLIALLFSSQTKKKKDLLMKVLGILIKVSDLFLDLLISFKLAIKNSFHIHKSHFFN